MYDPNKVDLSVVCIKSVGIGIVLCLTINSLIVSRAVDLSIYVLSITIFHLLEFLSTCLWNNSQIDDDSFILTDYDLHMVNIATIAEWYILKYLGYETNTFLKWLGLFVMVIGQSFRTLSMYTAKESFNHYIQRTKSKSHKLVTTGVYSFSRHPSYFGFFWWFIGLRLFMNNWLVLVYGGYKIWSFFNLRIAFEEEFLVKFFKEDYLDYKSRVKVGIPFIS